MKKAAAVVLIFLLCGCSVQAENVQESSPLCGKWRNESTVISLDGGICSVLSGTDAPELTYCADDSSITFFADVGKAYEEMMGMSEGDLIAQRYVSASDLEPYRISYRYTLSPGTLTLIPDREHSSPGAFDDLSPVTLHRDSK